MSSQKKPEEERLHKRVTMRDDEMKHNDGTNPFPVVKVKGLALPLQGP